MASHRTPLFLDFMIRLILVAIVFYWYEVPFKAQMILYRYVASCHFAGNGFGFCSIHCQSHLARYRQHTGHGPYLRDIPGPCFVPRRPTTWPLSLINILNPLSPLLIASQDMIAHGSVSQPQAFLFSCLFSVFVFLVAWRFFRLTIYRVSAYA